MGVSVLTQNYIVINVSGKTQLIGINGQTKELRNGDEWKLNCISDLYWYYKEGTSDKRGDKIVMVMMFVELFIS